MLSGIEQWLADRFPAVAADCGVPGAVVAVSVRGEVVDAATGVVNTGTGVPATTDSVFQIGSITKVWTATLVLQLVDEGLVALDDPVRRHLPDLRLGDEPAAASITVRQLLCHTAGFEGDLFTDTGRGDDCVRKYVDTLGDVDQLFAPGEMFSYNNAGYVVLGRLVEVLRGKPYDQCLRDHLFGPLGLTRAATCADEAILHRVAVGHLPGPSGDLAPAPVWSLMRSNGPAGSALAMPARELLAFAQMHLAGGAATDGTAVLSARSAKAMRERQVDVPPLGFMGDAWGLGWEIYDWPADTVIAHDGNTIGQSAFLRVLPDREIAVALLTNGGNAARLSHEVFTQLLGESAGVAVPPPGTPPSEPEPFDAARFVGAYGSRVAEMTVSQHDDGRVWLDVAPVGVLADMSETEHIELVRRDDDSLVSRDLWHGLHLPLVFVGDDGHGRARYLHNGRATRRAR